MPRKGYTQEDFINKAIDKHKDRFDYSLVEYKDYKTKVKIICKEHGVFEQKPCFHLGGSKCNICSSKERGDIHRKTSKEFTAEAKNKHNNKYNYDKVVYINNATPVVIGCSIHGDFEQTPSHHLTTCGCPQCGRAVIGIKNSNTKEEYLKRANEKHNFEYDYSKMIYDHKVEKITIGCKKHGYFSLSKEYHLKGTGCKKCGLERIGDLWRKDKEYFVNISNEKHGFKYNYDKTVYVLSTEKVTITCPVHGDFTQMPNIHITGKGCPQCGESSFWSRSDYIKKANGRECTFYTLKCFNETEEFYKIGITANTVKERYWASESMPYDYEIISEVKGEAGEIWDLELTEKRKLKWYKYQPLIAFKGSKRECFTKYTID